MVVNMACPKCGKQATEYDEHKWSCLHCGNKFLFVPQTASQTNNYVQNTVNVVGQTTYELDTQRAKPAKTIVKSRYDDNPEAFSYPPESISPLEQRASILETKAFGFGISKFGCGSRTLGQLITQNQNSKMLWLCCSILFGALALWGVTTKSWLLICIFPAVVSLLNYFIRCRDTTKIELMRKEAESHWQQTQRELADFEAKKNEKITVGYQPVCPFCSAEVSASSGLAHCHKCGKQFHYSNEHSYPLVFR